VSFLSDVSDKDWERAWSSMPNRTVREPSKLNLQLDPNLGKVLSATIAEAPSQYLEFLYLPTELCALCSKATFAADRVPTSVSVELDQLKGSIGICSWVHRTCFEELEISEKPAPIPW
jgi:hypothetical protein